jgi:hypothetical protein
MTGSRSFASVEPAHNRRKANHPARGDGNQMKLLYATAPSSFLDMPPEDGFRFQKSLMHLSEYFSDARLAKELFDAAAGQCLVHGFFTSEYRRAHRAKAMYAREFVFALDYFAKELSLMAKDPAAPVMLKTELENFKARVPDIVEMRNSLHHQEDRIRGRREHDQPIQPQSIDVPGVMTKGGVVFVGVNLLESKVSCTAADGRFVQIDISTTTLEEMIGTLQRVIDALPWQSGGWPMQYPHNDA